MKGFARILFATLFALSIAAFPVLGGCGSEGENKPREVSFSYSDKGFTPIYGDSTNAETFEEVIVNPVSGLRDDFMMGVDASMVATVEAAGGKYYNAEGREQDVFQILADHGVNFFRVRVWNDPFNLFGEGYGGGSVDADAAVEMSKRAAAAGMNILVDFHYSDFWADPETQEMPKDFSDIARKDLPAAVEKYTKESLNKFKRTGIKVDVVQIGNEINNGMMFNQGKINFGSSEEDDFRYLSSLIKAGIRGMRAVYPDAYSAIHLANGGNGDEFDVFFGQMKKNNVAYDLIGASYYPYYHGTLEALQNNLDRVSKKYGKHVYIAETSYGFTTEHNVYTENTYNQTMEDAGKYITGIQGQATAMRDVIEVVAKVPERKGMGMFYWEPAWLPVANAGWANAVSGRVQTDGKVTWANQGLFSYTGKALPSLGVFEAVKKDSAEIKEEKAVALRADEASYTLNLADGEQLPGSVAVETNLQAIRQFPITWSRSTPSEEGTYTITGAVQALKDAPNTVTATVEVIRNFVRDPSYEKQGKTDAVVAPWEIVSSAPAGEKVVKLDRKTDMRTGTTDLNWFHATKELSFEVSQTITGLESGTYSLSVYCMATTNHTNLEIYIKYNDGSEKTFDLKELVKGWGSKENYYIKAEINDLALTSGTVVVGIRGAAPAGAWGHLDDWALVKL